MKLYNTLTRKIEEFKPINPKEVKIYTCGPTVYSMPHIGNFAAYVYWDLLVRALKANGYGVKRVLNLTDVGHLTSDGDEGEDKLEKGAAREGKTVWQVADFYSKKFKKGMRELKLVEPDIIAKATDYIKQDEELVRTLMEKGYVYETNDGLYYDTSKFPTYTDFAKLNLSGQEAGKRVVFNSEKRNIADFALWKFIQPGENHAMRWDFLDRPGYPGWHIECSSIIHATLGEPIDIHTGGVDHIPVHHTNEIAQSEAAYGHRLANYWLHCHHLTVDGEKISKSLDNGWTLSDLQEKGYSPLDYKMWVLQGNYRTERDFSFEGLEAAKKRRLSWINCIVKNWQNLNANLDQDRNREKIYFREILDAINDNLNSANAFAIIDRQEGGSLYYWRKIDRLFGLGLIDQAQDVDSTVKQLLKDRQTARNNMDFNESDRLRDVLLQHNIQVLDTKEGQIWQYAN